MANKTNSFILGALVGLLLFVVPVFAAGSGLSITEVQTPFNFRDIGNLSNGSNQPWLASANYTLWANVQDSGADGTNGASDNLNFTNVTFVLPYGVNPANPGNCNATAPLIGSTNKTNGTLNATHVTCTIGYWNLTGGGTINVTLNVTINISALSSGTLYQTDPAAGGTRATGLIYAIANATNNSTVAFAGVESSATQHNVTSFWINPRPYGYAIGTTNATLYITKWDQTDPYYIMMVPLMKYNQSKGRPDPAVNNFAEIVYMNTSIMERPGYMRLFSYNLTFKFIFAGGTDAASTTFNITSPVTPVATYGNETLMPLLIQNATVFMPDGNFTMIMGIPSSGGFTVWHNNTTSTGNFVEFGLAELTSRFGITMSYNPASQQLLVNITNNTSALAANNTEFSVLFTLMNGTSGTSSPLFVNDQKLLGFSMDSPPPLGSNVTVSNYINITNALANYTLRDIRIRFMMPMNVTVNSSGTSTVNSFQLTNMSTANATYLTSGGSWAANWVGFLNSTSNINVTDSIPGSPAKGANISIWFSYMDINITNHTFNNWTPTWANASLNFTAYMTFPVMNETAVTGGANAGDKNYTATVQMNMAGRLNFTDKVPGLNNNSKDIVVKMDGQILPPNTGNYTIGSLTLDNVGAGSHAVEVTYSIPPALPPGGDTAGTGGAGGVAGLVVPAGVSESTFTVSAGTSIVVDFGAPSGGGGGEAEKHTVKVESLLGTTVTLKITSDPVIVKASVGIPAFVDVDGDGANDLKILVNQILKANSIDLTITKLRAAKAVVKEKVASEAEAPVVEAPTETPTGAVTETPAEEKPTAQPLSQTTMFLVVLVIIALVGAGYWFTQKKGQLIPAKRNLGWAIKYINDTLVKSACYGN